MGDPEGVDLPALSRWFGDHVPDAHANRQLTATLIAGGRSNLTYFVGDGTREWVLRRPPLGHVLPTAHDMGREHRVISALADTPVPVPRVDALCTDESVIGAPFYVMEKVEGRVLRDAGAVAALSADEAAACSRALVDVLASIHSVDPFAVGLDDFGRPEGYLERQVRRWGQQWERSKTRELPPLEELARRLQAALPRSGPPAIVHGDYRLDNTMLANDDAGRIVAVLDWEMSTLGDPLTDLGLFLVYWGTDTGPAVGSSAGIASTTGFLGSDEIVARYADRSGRSIEHLDFYVAFAMYKLAVILEGINARFLMGKTLGEGFDEMGEMVVQLARSGLDVADAAPDPALHR